MSDLGRVEYAKLVRDRIPEIIRASGADPVTRVLSPDEFLPAALDKVVEEARELRSAPAAQRLDELADVWEILDTVLQSCGCSWDQVRHRAEEKRESRGGFQERIWLDAVLAPAPDRR